MVEEKKKSLQNEIEMLNVRVAALEEELKASMCREELLKRRNKANRKRETSWIRKKAGDKNSKVGKIIRSPRTIYRIVRDPGVISQIRRKRKLAKEGGEELEEATWGDREKKLFFAPIGFFYGENDSFRVNLIINKIEEDILRKAVDFANQNKCELRIIACGKENPQTEYKKLVKQRKLPASKEVSFYSAEEQNRRENPFRLEIGKNDVFLTKAWNLDED